MVEDLTDQICFDRVVCQRDEARRRIEQLEAALREIDAACDYTGTDVVCRQIARAALKGKKDEK